MRQVVLDTETTGLEVQQGHRIIEIGCVELVDRRPTNRHFHHYINPQREIDDGALEVHGITLEFLQDKLLFGDICSEFLDFIKGAELVIHNAAFDLAFLNNELGLIDEDLGVIVDYCTVVDSLEIARSRHPGQKNNLDALCKRYGVDNSQRDLHGALLDAEILADVYLLLTGGQTSLGLGHEEVQNESNIQTKFLSTSREGITLKVISATSEELQSHQQKLDLIDNLSDGNCTWLHQP